MRLHSVKQTYYLQPLFPLLELQITMKKQIKERVLPSLITMEVKEEEARLKKIYLKDRLDKTNKTIIYLAI